MNGNPVMGTQARTIAKVEIYPNATTPGAVSVVSLSPKGTVVVNRDTRLPMIVMFTPDTIINQDLAQYTEQVVHAAQMLKALGNNESYVGVASATTNDVYVPAMLQTQWGQWAPFNNYMPVNPKMSGPAVTGCGTIGFAQILNHFQWPPYGEGKRTYKDQLGDFNPTFAAKFDHAYRWDLMRNNYDGVAVGAASKAVGQLAYDLATIGSIDCETNVSGINLDLTGNNLGTYLFYDKEGIVVGDAQSRQVIDDNLQRGIPVPADITINHNGDGHAIVFDGLLVRNGTTSYHTNYGWYGQYNLWWDKDAILSVWQAKPGILPALIPLPSKPNLVAKQGEPLQLPWKIASQRKAEAKELNLYQEVLKNGTWEDDCESLPAPVESRTWTLDNDSVSGSCWKANSPYGGEYLTFADEFIPTQNSVVQFQEKHVCADNYMTLEASVGGGEFKPLLTFGKEIRNYWQNQSVSLASFAGKSVRLRLSYTAPPNSGYYTTENGGGIWVDNMRVTDTLVKDWEFLDTIAGSDIQTIDGHDSITAHPNLRNLASGTYKLTASLTDQNNVEHRTGINFTLTITKSGEAPERFKVFVNNKAKSSGTTTKVGIVKKGDKIVETIMIQNTGTTIIKGIQVKTLGAGNKDFNTNLGKSTLAPGEKTILVIEFKPSKAGPRKMVAKITTSAGKIFRLKVTGKGKE